VYKGAYYAAPLILGGIGRIGGLRGLLGLTAEDAGAAAAPRLPQDIGVNPNPPAALPLTRPISSSATQNGVLQNRIAQLQQAGANLFRVNQQQVDINNIRVGINRPDLQYTLNGQRWYEEFETTSIDAAYAHMPRIMANDPFGQFIPWFQP
jgi:hypothetical protein